MLNNEPESKAAPQPASGASQRYLSFRRRPDKCKSPRKNQSPHRVRFGSWISREEPRRKRWWWRRKNCQRHRHRELKELPHIIVALIVISTGPMRILVCCSRRGAGYPGQGGVLIPGGCHEYVGIHTALSFENCIR
jgi:hypothetical protein